MKDKIITTILVIAAIVTIVIMITCHLSVKARQRTLAPRYGLVTGVIYNDEKPAAVIDNQIVHEGTTIHGVKVVKISRDKVQFQKNNRVWTQSIEEKPNLTWPEIDS